MRTAIITGAGSGIGRAAALRLARDGCAVVLVGRRLKLLEEVAREIQSAGGKALAVRADVTKCEQVDAMVAKAVESFGRVDVLVNNAGAAQMVPMHKMTPAQWHEVLESNLSSAFYAIRAVWPIMQRQHAADKGQSGVIVNISSMASKDPFPGLGAYGAAKVGLNMLTLVTAREGEEFGIRSVGIAPAAVDTPMFRGLVGSGTVAEGIMLVPEDIAAMIADAVSGSLRYCSGDTIFIHRRPA